MLSATNSIIIFLFIYHLENKIKTKIDIETQIYFNMINQVN
jgi:hypothetical protein